MALKRAETKRAETDPRQSRAPRSFGAGRRWAARIEVVIGVVLALYILLVANLIAFRHPVRFDLTAEGQHTLSPETVKRLESVNQEIRVVFPTYLQTQNPEHQAVRRVLTRARALLREYMAIQPRITVVEELDVFADPNRWDEVRRRYELTSNQVNRFIFMTGAASELRQTVTPRDLAVFGATRDPAVAAPEIKGFRGEKAFTDAITRLIRRERKPVYFTQDNQEMPLEAKSPRDPGVKVLARELETSGYEVRSLPLSSRDVPADCEILFILRPTSPFSQIALRKIEAYLERGGRLFVALGPAYTGIEEVLDRWGIESEEGGVIERRTLGTARQDSYEPIVRTFHPTHPVTSVFEEAARFEMLLYAPRPLRVAGRSRGLDGVALLELLSKEEEGTRYYHVSTEDRGEGGFTLPRPGHYAVAVAMEQLVPERPPPGFQRLDTRIVCVGSASFLADHRLPQFSHRDFAVNCVLWLTGSEEDASVGAQEWVKRTLKMTGPIREFLFWVPIFVFPGICLVMGGFVYFVRRT